MASIYEKVIVDDPNQFDSVVAKYTSNDQFKVVLVHITGAVDKNTNKSWCPDCVTAEPVITNIFENVQEQLEENGVQVNEPQIAFIKCPCPREPYKKPDHPYRVHSKVQVKSIPTMILWDEKTSYRVRLVEGQFRDGSKVLSLVNEIVKRLQ